MSEITDKHNNDTLGIDIVLSVLQSGHSVELPATGYSMFPVLRPGDRAVVNPIPEGALPVLGSVIVCLAESVRVLRSFSEGGGRRAQSGKRKPHTACRIPHTVLVMHRLVEIKKDDSGNLLLITRGDSIGESDPSWHQDQIIGSVDSFTRNNRSCMIKTRVPFEPEYKIKRWMLWIWLKSGER